MISSTFIKDIQIDSSLQSRVKMSDSVVSEYSAAMMEGQQFPPVVIFDDGEKKFLADGFHRLAASRAAGRDRIEADVRNGTRHDAFLFSLQANATHGLRRTVEDKRYCVQMIIEDIEYAELSDRQISQICLVSHTFVSRIRAEIKKPAATNKFTPVNRSQTRVLQQSPKVATLPPPDAQEYDPRDDVLKELTEENEALTDRLSIQAMDASEEEKALASETIAQLREENRLLSLECNSLKISRNSYQHEASEAKKQCNINQHVIKKLNNQIAELQAKLKQHPPEEEPLPF